MTQTRLTKTPSEFVLSKLSRELYVDFLEHARRREFSFLRFKDFLPNHDLLPTRYIVLRHDIDFAPSYSLQMAELEHEAGIASTFFVLVDGQFYNPVAPEVLRQIRRIYSLGHEIGLHFAVSSAINSNIGKEVAFRLEILSSIVGDKIRSFSQHDPVNAGFTAVTLPSGHYSCVDVSQVIPDNNLLYVSDSAMMWRRYTFHTALNEERNLCLLAHPHSWLHEQDDYVAMIREFESIEVQAVADRFNTFVEALTNYYSRRLKEGI